MKLLLINGAPRAGKDCIAAHTSALTETHYPHLIPCVERFSFPLKACFSAIMEVELDDNYQVPDYENRKEELIPLLNTTYRQFQIDLFEKFFKPVFGPTILAHLFLKRIETCTDDELQSDEYREWLFIVPDCGFQIELDAVLRSLRFKPEDVHLITVHRPGYLMDSRELVVPPANTGRSVIYNTGTLDTLHTEVERVLAQWIVFPPLSLPDAHTEGNSA